MANWILFETTEAVIEVLWDIALAFFLIRLGFIYFILSLTSVIAVSYLAYAHLLPAANIASPQSEFAMIPFYLLLSVFWARFVASYYQVPRVMGFRLVIGGLGLGFMVLAELITALVLYEEGHGGWLAEMHKTTGLAMGLLLLAFALMPVLSMVCEGSSNATFEEEASHEHHGKGITEAVYVSPYPKTVNQDRNIG